MLRSSRFKLGTNKTANATNETVKVTHKTATASNKTVKATNQTDTAKHKTVKARAVCVFAWASSMSLRTLRSSRFLFFNSSQYESKSWCKVEG